MFLFKAQRFGECILSPFLGKKTYSVWIDLVPVSGVITLCILVFELVIEKRDEKIF
jgi:hypothetical protein